MDVESKSTKADAEKNDTEDAPRYLVINEDAYQELAEYLDGDGDISELEFFDFE